MKTQFLSQETSYDGSQLKPLFAYLNHGLLGNSVVSWIGPCSVSFANMKDGEDLRDRSAIEGSRMVHFIVELFDRELFSAVCMQRLMASLAKDVIEEATAKAGRAVALHRSGDDLYFEKRKLSISIAAPSPVSTMIHFAVNVSNQGTPVPTCALEDFGLDGGKFAEELMSRFAAETMSILEATQKVLPCT